MTRVQPITVARVLRTEPANAGSSGSRGSILRRLAAILFPVEIV